jgi:hypothetical protein
MSMSVSITCDGCGLTEEASTSYESGTNEIDGALDEGWEHEGGEDFCPECAGS